MCEQMKVPDMANKINKFLQAKENKEIFQTSTAGKNEKSLMNVPTS